MARNNPVHLLEWVTRISDMEPLRMPSQEEFEKFLAGDADLPDQKALDH